ncbi:MAG: hypothetical protein DI607_10400 [Sphingomonas hengshuiensis]|nr:MAG: hypothetical protein DI607_10400 [Sphingomonas hengshuiensis]
MARIRARFTAAEVTRAFKGAQNAGVQPRVEIDLDGKIVVMPAPAEEPAVRKPVATMAEDPNPWDEAIG